MSREFHFSIVSVPSRIVSVGTLREWGVEFPTLNQNQHAVLAEVRPEVGQPNSEESARLFVATAEVENGVFQARFKATKEWFLELVPISILLNIPNDLSAIT